MFDRLTEARYRFGQRVGWLIGVCLGDLLWLLARLLPPLRSPLARWACNGLDAEQLAAIQIRLLVARADLLDKLRVAAETEDMPGMATQLGIAPEALEALTQRTINNGPGQKGT